MATTSAPSTCLSAGRYAALAKLDLLVRRGVVGPDDPDYLDLIAQLRQATPYVRT